MTEQPQNFGRQEISIDDSLETTSASDNTPDPDLPGSDAPESDMVGSEERVVDADPPLTSLGMPAPAPHLSLVLDDGMDSLEDQWQERALCAQTDPEAFFPEKGGSTREAKRICLGCEVKDDCLDYALAHDERFGIWGGLSERERRRLKRGIV